LRSEFERVAVIAIEYTLISVRDARVGAGLALPLSFNGLTAGGRQAVLYERR
jgi:hypothetical protein